MAEQSERLTADLMTVEQLAVYLDKSPGSIHQMVHRRVAPPSAKIGGRRVFRRRQVDEWIEEQFRAASA